MGVRVVFGEWRVDEIRKLMGYVVGVSFGLCGALVVGVSYISAWGGDVGNSLVDGVLVTVGASVGALVVGAAEGDVVGNVVGKSEIGRGRVGEECRSRWSVDE